MLCVRSCYIAALALLAVATLADVRAARAQASEPAAPPMPSASEQDESMRTLDDEARQRFELGRTFYEAGRFPQAAEEFGEAYRLSQRPQLLYNLYVAHRDAGNWTAATDSLRRYLELVPDAPDRINLRARLSSMEAQMQKQAEQEQAERERERVEAERIRTEQEARRPRRSIVPFLLVGSGGALLATSLVTGLVAKGKDSELDDECAQGGALCPESRRDDAKRTYALALTTDILWTTGAALAVTGLVLWWTGALDRARKDAATARARPYLPEAELGLTRSGLAGSLTVRY